MFKLQKSSRIKAINAACGQLGIDTESRHALQARLTGKQSLTEMTLPELDAVLDHLCACGARLGVKGTPANLDHKPLLAKIEALLADMGLPWAYADKIAEHITGGKKPEAIKRLAWVPAAALKGVIAQLDKQHKKRTAEARALLCNALAARGITGAAMHTWCQEQLQRPGVHTADHPWSETIETLKRLTALAKELHGSPGA